MLAGAREDVVKQGLNHEVQGTVVDLLDLALIEIQATWPDSHLAYQEHDAGRVAFPADMNPSYWWLAIRSVAEQTWPIGGRSLTFTASWSVRLADGTSCTPEEYGGTHA